MEKIALIAGNGKLPLLFAQAAKNTGVYLVAIAIKEETEKDLAAAVDKMYWISVGQLKMLIEILKKEQVKKAIMVGQIRHRLLFSDIELDDELKILFSQLKDKRTDTILGAVAKRISALGIELINSTTFIKDHLVPKGIFTKCSPSDIQWQDIEFGQNIAKAVAALDIGQTVVVKDKVVLSIEAIEGTDLAIARGSAYAKTGAIVVKVSKPKQDMRFDVPLIGKGTIETLIKNKIAVLAIEADKTLFLDKDYVLDKANKHNICIVAV